MAKEYTINIQHRNGNVNKSQWRIIESDEISCFQRSDMNGWLIGDKGWGIHVVNSKPYVLGVAKNHITRVFIAKFVGDNMDVWHGYPVDYRKSTYDIPHEGILKNWLEQGMFTVPQLRKIAKGQPCNL